VLAGISLEIRTGGSTSIKSVSDLKKEATVTYLSKYTASHLRRTSSAPTLTLYLLLTNYSQERSVTIYGCENIGTNTQIFARRETVMLK
jgi:hypothetical protein